MRKWFVPVLMFVLSIFMLAPSRGLAEGQEPAPRNEISLDLAMPVAFNLVFPQGAVPIVLEYQRVLNDHLVLSISPGIAYVPQSNKWLLLMELWVGLNWHPFQEGLQGFYVGPGIAVFDNLEHFETGGSDSLFGVFLGLTIGYQFVLTQHLNVDLALGLAIGSVDGAFGGLPRAALSVGYRF